MDNNKVPPNLFYYATSELSQDAFICWLLAWVDRAHQQTDAALNNCGRELIRSFFRCFDLSSPDVETVEIHRQIMNVDVLCLINDSHAILIEDKIGSSEHSGQLKRYKEAIEKEYPDRKIIPIYLKIEEQSNLEPVTDAGYALFSRKDFLQVLKDYSGSSQILKDYRARLNSISKKVDAYKDISPDKWDDSYAWQGFFQHLQDTTADILKGNWAYVPNESGGFMAFYWGFHDVENCKLYIQLEAAKLCVKIEVTSDADKSETRNLWSERILKKMETEKYRNLKLQRPAKFGYGETMTVAEFSNDYRIKRYKGILDREATTEGLKLVNEMLQSLAEEN